MNADDPKINKAFINWFEGNVAIGPDGTLYVKVSAEADAVIARLEGSVLDGAAHLVSLLLVDAATGRPVTLDYGLDTVRTVEGGPAYTATFGG